MSQETNNLSWAIEQLRRQEKGWRWFRIYLLGFCSFVGGSYVFGDGREDFGKLLPALLPAVAWATIFWVIARWKGNPTRIVLLKLIETERAKTQGG